MTNLIFIITTIALLIGFVVLADYEARRGVRLYASHRERLDRNVERIHFILAHINLGEFLGGEIRHLASRVGHDIVHFSLLLVRAVERLLTRLVRHMRTHPEMDQAPRETAREFVKTLSDFKGNLKGTHPEISDRE